MVKVSIRGIVIYEYSYQLFLKSQNSPLSRQHTSRCTLYNLERENYSKKHNGTGVT